MGIVIGRLPYPFAVEDLEAGDEVGFDDFAIHALNVRHRGRAFGYALVEDPRPGRFDADRARELGVPFGPAFGRLQRGETVDGVAPEQVVGPPRPGRKVVLSGDTAPCEMVRVAAHHADLLVHEATFLAEDAARARDTQHSTARQAAELAAEADVGLLALVHLSSRYPVRDVLAEAREHFPRTEAPRDFDSIEVPLPEKGEPALARWDPPARAPVETAP
jgi:ribonuclease Z